MSQMTLLNPRPTSTPQRLRILWVNLRLLHPLNGGDRIRTFNMLRHLKRGNDVTYLCFRTPEDPPEAITRSGEFCNRLLTVPYTSVRQGSLRFVARVLANTAAGGVPFFAQKYRSPAMTAEIRRLAEDGSVDLIVADYLSSMVHLAGMPRLAVPVLIFQHNVESQIWKRHAETTRNPIRRSIFLRQWSMAREWERACDEWADGQVAVSAEDAAFFRDELGLKKILGDVPTGVDLDYFVPADSPRDPHSLMFLGSMDWMANIDAVQFFVADIWPAVRQRFPDATFTIVGRRPPRHIEDMARRTAGVRVTGTVDDVRPYLARSAAMVVPLRVGGGTRIKIFEGMATAIPVVSTRVGAEGLPVRHGEHLWLADEPDAFADAIAQLFRQPALAARIGSNGRRLVEARFGWDKVTRVFEDYCRQVAASAAPEREEDRPSDRTGVTAA